MSRMNAISSQMTALGFRFDPKSGAFVAQDQRNHDLEDKVWELKDRVHRLELLVETLTTSPGARQ